MIIEILNYDNYNFLNDADALIEKALPMQVNIIANADNIYYGAGICEGENLSIAAWQQINFSAPCGSL